MADFDWTPQRLEAAQLVASGELTFVQIADRVGVTSRSLYSWRDTPEFAAYVEELRSEFRQYIRRRGIAILERRVDAQNDRWMRMQRVIAERAADPAMAEVAGGTTGLLVRQLKSLGSGENATIVEEFEVDVGLLKEIREVEKQAAQELGQWTEKVEATGSGSYEVRYVNDWRAHSADAPSQPPLPPPRPANGQDAG